MHPDEILADETLAARLVATQFPQWRDLPVTRVRHSGTDNAIFRLGDELAARLPRIHWATAQADKEFEWLPRLAPYLPLAVPTPLCKGAPAFGYPWPWAVYAWLDGDSALDVAVATPPKPRSTWPRSSAHCEACPRTTGRRPCRAGVEGRWLTATPRPATP